MKKTNLIILGSAFLFAACESERISELTVRQMNISAVIENDNSTKTSLGSKEGGIYKTLWDDSDVMDVFCDYAGPYQFTLSDGAGSIYGKFQGEGLPASRYVALYPTGLNPTINGNTVSFTLPSEQQYREGSFGEGAFPMISVSKGTDFVFKNLSSVLKISIKGKYPVRSIVFLPNDTTLKVSGPARVSTEFTDEPELVMDSDAKGRVKLNCGDIVLSEEKATDFYVVIPSQTYKGGFTIEINTTNWVSPLFKKTTTKDFTPERSMLYSMEEFQLEDSGGTGDPERDALIALYNATDGDHWTRNDNWCTDKPLSEWYGIGTLNGHVTCINLQYNNMKGEIPNDITKLTELEVMYLDNPDLTGTIPENIGSLEKLKELGISNSNISGTIPLSLFELSELTYLFLFENNLEGTLSPSIGKLTKLKSIRLDGNNLEGPLPASIGELKELEYLWLCDNNFTGSLPSAIGNLTNLKYLMLYSNSFSGSLLPELANLTNLEKFSLTHNMFQGPIPEQYRSWKQWIGAWYDIVGDTYISEDEIMSFGITAPDFHITDFYGKQLDNTVLAEYKYTALLHSMEWTSDYWFPIISELYQNYHDLGFNIIEWSDDDASATERMAKERVWTFFDACASEYNNISGLKNNTYYPGGYVPELTVVDSTGTVIKTSNFDGSLQNTVDFIKDLFSGEHPEYYTSTDYSADGTVKILQSASKGNGIDVVLMGDAYSDRLIADGTYDAAMQDAMEAFFAEEPYKSFRDMFIVYEVRVVSKNEVYGPGASTALKTGFGDGTLVYGDNTKCINYALNAIPDERIEESVVITICNANKYAGTCYMYPPSDETDWGDGLTISYFPLGEDLEDFGNILRHEAAGHGFPKLGDEYAYESMGRIPQSKVESYRKKMSFGWWKNIDFTSDTSSVRWAKFLRDSRYQYDGLGVFEGGATYWSGVWRPTDYSIMRHNTDGFNAPSREAIYYRIHKLAYGNDWKYNYEEFVKYDAINRKSTPGQASAFKAGVSRLPEPTHPPVIVNKNWRQELKTDDSRRMK